MRAERGIGIGFVAAVLASASVAAFEPGTPRVCTPSADGQRFECHERGAAGEPAALPPRTSVDAPAVAPSPSTPPASTAPAPAPASGSRALPNYLLQSPTRAAPAPAPAAADKPRTVVADAPAPPPAPAPAAAASAANTTPTDTPAPVAAPLIEAEATEAPAPATTTPRESVAAPAQPEPVAPAEEAGAPSTPTAPTPPAPPEETASRARTVAGATEFRRLAVARYTVELAKAARADAFEALLAALGDVDGTLYLVSLRGPDGSAWHLLWSDFASIEEARAARAGLPADAAIASGWPRRIGPLRAELDAP